MAARPPPLNLLARSTGVLPDPRALLTPPTTPSRAPMSPVSYISDPMSARNPDSARGAAGAYAALLAGHAQRAPAQGQHGTYGHGNGHASHGHGNGSGGHGQDMGGYPPPASPSRYGSCVMSMRSMRMPFFFRILLFVVEGSHSTCPPPPPRHLVSIHVANCAAINRARVRWTMQSGWCRRTSLR
jgi:hypothetical protein